MKPSMSERDLSLYIVDILIAHNRIERYTLDFASGDALLESELNWDATIRELEIIGEATKTLINSNLVNQSFRRIVDFRNRISHGYFGIDAAIVWNVVTKKLPEFVIEVKRAAGGIDLSKAIDSAKTENRNNPKVLAFLETL